MYDPIRYTAKAENQTLGSPHWEHAEGEWVRWVDYAHLKEQNLRLRIELAEAQENHHQLNKIVKGLLK